MMPIMRAQTTSKQQPNTIFKPIKKTTTPLSNAGLLQKKKQDHFLLREKNIYAGIQNLYPIIDASLDYRKSKRNVIWRDNVEFSNENLSKLPAVNTGDIIKILDKDGVLTNW